MGDAAAVGGGPRSSVAWSYSGRRPEAFFEAAAPRATAKAGKPKRQSRQHEKATKSKVKSGARRCAARRRDTVRERPRSSVYSCSQ